MSEHSAGQPGAVGAGAARWDVFESGAFFEISDREFNDGVFAMELIGLDHGQVGVGGDEGVMTLVRPKATLGNLGEPSSAHDEADRPGLGAGADGVGGFGDFHARR